jgi:inner membrane protein
LPSAFSHVVAAAGLAACFYRPEVPKRMWLVGALAAAAPDLDVIGFRFGIEYGDALGHRGLTHSIPFAGALAGLVALTFRSGVPGLPRGRLWFFNFLATASHGLLDALTDGGLGVALLAPLDNSRYFFPVRPIRVSPIGIRRFFSERGLQVIGSELLWVWLPSFLVAGLALGLRRGRSARLRPSRHRVTS